MKKMKEGITRQASMGMAGSGGGSGAGANINTGALGEKLTQFKKDIDRLHDTQVQDKTAILTKLQDNEKKSREITDEAIHRHGHKLQTGLMKFVSDLKAGHNDVSTKLDGIGKVVNRLRDLHAAKAFAEGSILAVKVVEKWILSLTRLAFVRWRDSDPYGMMPVGQKLQGILVKVWLKYTTHYGFNLWKSKITAMNRRGVIKDHLRNILTRWKTISFRDIKSYFVLWKRHALYTSYLARENQLRKDRSAVAREPLTQVGDMVRRLGGDIDGKLLMIGEEFVFILLLIIILTCG